MNAEMNSVLRNSTPNSVSMNVTPTPWLNPPLNDVQTESLTAQQVALNDQIRESETNLNAQHKVSIFVATIHSSCEIWMTYFFRVLR